MIPTAIARRSRGDRCASERGQIAQKILCLVQRAHHLVDHSTSRSFMRTMEPRKFTVGRRETPGERRDASHEAEDAPFSRFLKQSDTPVYKHEYTDPAWKFHMNGNFQKQKRSRPHRSLLDLVGRTSLHPGKRPPRRHKGHVPVYPLRLEGAGLNQKGSRVARILQNLHGPAFQIYEPIVCICLYEHLTLSTTHLSTEAQ